ncbi:hypothetical protein [aff. Roholtiella sp. LEGE 12411]|uniref:hypothetical protein n=1 Tax=aff. Roholtiella sp. LEGE 12411 TaxID=1828822 RepID=UPI00187E57B9|nr:hypothetical protein [aff. Roholtiella sp. LEGE 12411]
MTRKGESVTLSLSSEQKQQLEQIALDFGQTWGEEPNISKLMRAIADGDLKVIWGDEELPMTSNQRSMMKAAIATIQEGLSKLIKLI